MTDLKLYESEYRFMDLIWEAEPVRSTELAKMARERLEWKKSTTYTMLRRLCQKGLFENRDGTVIVRISPEEFRARQSKQFVEETFDGSLPRFLAAFASQKKLSQEEIQELQQWIDQMDE